ncbi:DNA repair protein RadC [Thermodesulfobacteriota bacterium]
MDQGAMKSWPLSERPRERLLTLGPERLDDAELLAIILRTGCAGGQSALDQAGSLLERFRGLKALREAAPQEIASLKGLGPAKIAGIKAALEIARRMENRDAGGCDRVGPTFGEEAPAVRLKIEALADRILDDGEEGLSDPEIVAILVGDLDLASGLVQRFGSIRALENASVQEMMDCTHMTGTAAARVRAALSLSGRAGRERIRRGEQIMCSEDAHIVLLPMMRRQAQEVFVVCSLDARHKLTRPPVIVSRGSVMAAVVHPREVFLPLIRDHAAAAIVAHNHPSSGDPTPSPEDRIIHDRITKAGELLGIKVLDHLVIGDGVYYSFADHCDG